jgi:hypothetical protein
VFSSWSSLLFLGQGVAQPVQTLVKTIASRGRCALDVPLPVPELVEAEALSDFLDLHGVGQVLLVGENEQNGVTELVLSQHAVELVLGAVLISIAIIDTIPIVTVDNEDAALGVLVVVTPERANLVLSSDIPYSEGDILVLDSLDVETNGGDGGHDLAQLELIQDGGSG